MTMNGCVVHNVTIYAAVLLCLDVDNIQIETKNDLRCCTSCKYFICVNIQKFRKVLQGNPAFFRVGGLRNDLP